MKRSKESSIDFFDKRKVAAFDRCRLLSWREIMEKHEKEYVACHAAPKPQRRIKSAKKRRFGSDVLFVASLLLVFYAVFQLGSYIWDLAASDIQTSQLSQLAVTEPLRESPAPPSATGAPLPLEQSRPMETAESPRPTEEPREKAPIQVDFSVLKAQSKDIIGWLYCPDTPINNPVMQSKNNLDYIRMLPDGSYNDTGSLFLDFRHGSDFCSGYSVIYGHNINNGSMFGSLDEYKDQDYYEAHKAFYLFTEEAVYRVDLLAGVTCAGFSDYYDIPMDREKARAKVAEAIENSHFQSDAAGEADHYLLFSTCSYEFEDARFLLIGSLTEIDPL